MASGGVRGLVGEPVWKTGREGGKGGGGKGASSFTKLEREGGG